MDPLRATPGLAPTLPSAGGLTALLHRLLQLGAELSLGALAALAALGSLAALAALGTLAALGALAGLGLGLLCLLDSLDSLGFGFLLP